MGGGVGGRGGWVWFGVYLRARLFFPNFFLCSRRRVPGSERGWARAPLPPPPRGAPPPPPPPLARRRAPAPRAAPGTLPPAPGAGRAGPVPRPAPPPPPAALTRAHLISGARGR